MSKKVTFKVKLQVRERPVTGQPVGYVYPGDVVYGEINNHWIYFTRVHRVNGQVESLSGFSSAASMYATVEDGPEPPRRVIKHVILVFEPGADVTIDEEWALRAVRSALP